MNSTFGIFRTIKYLAKLGNIVVETLSWTQMFPSSATRETLICCGNKFCCSETEKKLLPQVENSFAFRVFEGKVSQVDLATIMKMLTSFQCYSSKIFPSNGARRIMADGEVEIRELRESH